MSGSPFAKAVGIGLAVLAISSGIGWFCAGCNRAENANLKPSGESASSVSSLSALLVLPAEALQHVEVAQMNLLCAQGLPGADDLDVNRCLSTLDEMAGRVRSETERHLYRFQENPAEFENSEGFFRMIMLAVVLGEDFGVQYAPARIGTPADAHLGDGFFADAHDVFLHGLAGPKRQGTCSSLPVLQVAVGRRLGYPLKLVTMTPVGTKGTGCERFKIPHARGE